MSDPLREAIEELRARMEGIAPGDVLGPLSSHVPPGYQIVVLDRLPDGAIVLSLPFSSLPSIVPHPCGPYRWSSEVDSLIDANGDPHMLIDLDTLVEKSKHPSLPALYQKMVAFTAEHPVIGIEATSAILQAETEMMVKLDFLLSPSGTRAVEDNFVRCCQLILGGDTDTRLSEREQAFLITVMHNILIRCLGNSCVVRVVPTPSAPSSPTGQH